MMDKMRAWLPKSWFNDSGESEQRPGSSQEGQLTIVNEGNVTIVKRVINNGNCNVGSNNNIGQSSEKLEVNCMKNVPKPVTWFTGRTSEINQLEALLDRNRIVPVVGRGGYGKTELSKKFVDTYQHKYKSAMFIRSENFDSLQSSICELCENLKIRIKNGDKERRLEDMIKDIYNQLLKPCVFIFDNIESCSDIYPLLPEDEQIHVIITTRIMEWSLWNVLELKVLGIDDGMSLVHNLLQDQFNNITDTKALRELLNSVDRWPLVISQMSASIKTDIKYRSKTADEAIANLKTKLQNQSPPFLTQQISDYKQTVFLIISDSIKKIKEQKGSEFVLDKLYIMSFLSTDYIKHSDFPDKTEELLDILKQYSLIDSSINETRISIHRLVQHAVRNHLTEISKFKYYAKETYKFINKIRIDRDVHIAALVQSILGSKQSISEIFYFIPNDIFYETIVMDNDGTHLLQLLKSFLWWRIIPDYVMCRVRNVATMKILLRSKLCIILRSTHKQLLSTSLQDSSKNDSRETIELVKFLIESGYDIESRDLRGHTPLANAVKYEKIEAARILLNKGANIDCINDNQETLLHLAVQNRFDGELMSLLIEKGCNIEARNKYGYTPLAIAVAYKNMEAVEFLLRKEANINCIANNQNTLLHLAVLRDIHNDVISRLIEHGLDIEARNEDGCTPLALAVEYKNMGAVQMLLRKEANINCVNNDKETLLHLAVDFEMTPMDLPGVSICENDFSRREIFNREITNLLIEKGCDIEAKNKDGNTPLAKAVKCNNMYAAVMFLGKGANIHCVNNYEETLLHLAALNHHDDQLTSLLIEKECYIEAIDKYGFTPLELAFQFGKLEVAKKLRSEGANHSTMSIYFQLGQ